MVRLAGRDLSARNEFIHVSVGTPNVLPRWSGHPEKLNSGVSKLVNCFREITHREAGDRSCREMLFARIVGRKDFDVAPIGS
jgi:hypothetical protein